MFELHTIYLLLIKTAKITSYHYDLIYYCSVITTYVTKNAVGWRAAIHSTFTYYVIFCTYVYISPKIIIYYICFCLLLLLVIKDLEELEAICGKFKGIQGHHNSCYLDATLFSMFTFTNVFDSILYRRPNSEVNVINYYK